MDKFRVLIMVLLLYCLGMGSLKVLRIFQVLYPKECCERVRSKENYLLLWIDSLLQRAPRQETRTKSTTSQAFLWDSNKPQR